MHRLPFLLIVFSLIALPVSPLVMSYALAEEAKKENRKNRKRGVRKFWAKALSD